MIEDVVERPQPMMILSVCPSRLPFRILVHSFVIVVACENINTAGPNVYFLSLGVAGLFLTCPVCSFSQLSSVSLKPESRRRITENWR